jgi:hypothetical protein
MLSRDPFDTDLSNYAPPAETPAELAERAAAATQPTWSKRWWRRLSSLIDEQERRQEASRAALEGDLAKLTLQGTILGPEPKAYISGRMVREGEIIGGFRLIHIDARHVILAKSGCNVRLTMP